MVMSVSLTDTPVQLPSACECGCLTGKLVTAAGQKYAAETSAQIAVSSASPLAPQRFRTLAAIGEKFGASEYFVFRNPDSVRAKIERQDLFLRTHYVRDGRSMYQVISDIFDGVVDEPPIDSDGIEAVDD